MGRRRSLALGMLVGPLLATAGAGLCRDDFGRWQGAVQECRVQVEGQNGWSCQRLEVVQTSDQVISLRFVRNRDDRLGHRRLQLIGLVKEGEGLACSPDGCNLTPHLHLRVTGLETLDFNSRGLARSSPGGAVARGQCQWMQRQLSCQLRSGQGPNWTIHAAL